MRAAVASREEAQCREVNELAAADMVNTVAAQAAAAATFDEP